MRTSSESGSCARSSASHCDVLYLVPWCVFVVHFAQLVVHHGLDGRSWHFPGVDSFYITLLCTVKCCCSHINSHVIKSVVTGQAPVILEWRNSPGKKAQTKPKVVHAYIILVADAIHASATKMQRMRSRVSLRCARSILVHTYVALLAPEKPTTPLATQKRLPRTRCILLCISTSGSSQLEEKILRTSYIIKNENTLQL